MEVAKRPTVLVGIDEAARILGYSVRQARIRLETVRRYQFGQKAKPKFMWLRRDVEKAARRGKKGTAA